MTNKKHFELIHGGKIALAPGERFIKSAHYAQLLSAEELLEKVKEDAALYKEEVAKDAEKIKEKAAHEGFHEGLEQWAEKLKFLEEEIRSVQQEITKLVIPVALKAAKKIIGRELELSKEAVVDIIMNTLKTVAHHKKIKVYVSKEDLPTLDVNKEKIKALFDDLQSLLLIESDDVKPGGCIIETEGGIINAQLENLWRVLEKAFESFVQSGEST